MPIDKSRKSTSIATTVTKTWDTADNLNVQGDGTASNLNLTGANLAKGASVTMLDGGAIGKAFSFVENLVKVSADQTTRALNVTAAQANKERDISPAGESQATFSKILIGAAIVGGLYLINRKKA